MKHLQQQHSNHHQRQHLNNRRGSSKATPPRRKQCISVVVAQSRILSFHPGESPRFQKQCLRKTIARYNQWSKTLGFHPGDRGSVLEKHPQNCCPPMLTPHPFQGRRCKSSTSDTQEKKPVSPFFNAIKTPRTINSPITATMTFFTTSTLWKSILRHVPWHRQDNEASRHTLMKPLWLKMRARPTESIPI